MRFGFSCFQKDGPRALHLDSKDLHGVVRVAVGFPGKPIVSYCFCYFETSEGRSNETVEWDGRD